MLHIPIGRKLIRFYRLQFAPRLTDKNKLRLRLGKRLVGRPMPRLLSYDLDDLYEVSISMTIDETMQMGRQSGVVYCAVCIGSNFYPMPDLPEFASVVQACIADKRFLILPQGLVW